MSISSSLADNGNVLTIKVEGRFDFSSLQEFKDAYEKVDAKPEAYVVDLQGSEFLDSSALGMMLALRDYAGGDAANVTVQNCNPDVKKILVITKLDELFNVA